MGEFHAGWSLGTIRRHGPGEVLAMGSCWDVLPTLGHSFPAPARSPPLLPPPLPFPPPPPPSPCGSAVGAAAFVSSCLVPFRFVLSCFVACLSLPLFASCPVSVSFRLASLAVFPLLAPSRGHLHINNAFPGSALRGPSGGDEIALRAPPISDMSATSPTCTARTGGDIMLHW